jgi:acyl-CoA reductase-like NAD-dependent aldehyde dehydrogenase
LREHQDELAELLTREQGKPIGQSVAEIDRGAAQSEGMVGIEIPVEPLIEDDQKVIELRYRPLGIVAIITPWNAPVNLALGPLVSALYTGNCVVLKPSPYTPLTTLKLGELLKDIFPAGVVNVLAGGDELGQAMTEHADIDKISFTGSVATGKKVLASARARRQRSGNHHGRCRPESDREESLFRFLRQQRPGLHGDQAHLCSREDLRRPL